MKSKLSPLAWLFALPAFILLVSLSCIDPEEEPIDHYQPSPSELAAQGVQLIEEIYDGNVIAIQGNRAFVGTFESLTVVDISTPAALRVTGRSDPLPNVIFDLVLSGDYAYVADGGAGLVVMNIAQDVPYLVSHARTEDLVSNIAISENYAYLFEWFTGLRVMEISDPTRPQRVGLFEASIFDHGLSIAGNYAYVVDSEYGLRVIDISDPYRPHQVADFKPLPSGVEALASQGDYVFVSDSGALLRALDISFPTDPVVRSFIRKTSSGSVSDILISGGFAYIIDSQTGLQIVDIEDPTQLRLVSTVELRGGTEAIAISQGYAYFSGQYGGMTVVDISDPFNPIYVLGH
mgnify:CR=1 FL=1